MTDKAIPKIKLPNGVLLYNLVGLGIIFATAVFIYMLVRDVDKPVRPDGIEVAIQQLTPQQVQEQLNEGEAVLVDVRTLREWEEGEHIDGAISIPIVEFSQNNTELISSMLPDKDAPIIVTCYSHNSRSMRAADWLRKHGYTNIQNLDGGLATWIDQGLPTVPFVTLDDET